MEIANKKVLVVGLGISGLAAAKFLINQKAHVTISDNKNEQKLLTFTDKAREIGAVLELGQHRIATFEKADLIVISPGVADTILPIKRAREKGIKVIGEIELASRFIKKPIIAITGTNGKTTTVTLLEKMLQNSGLKVFTGGNIGNPLTNYLNHQQKADVVVVEVSSFQLETIDTFRPKVGVLLNITNDHIDRYNDFTAYAKAKKRIFANQQTDDIAIVNGSDLTTCLLCKDIKSSKVFYCKKECFNTGATISDEYINISLPEKKVKFCIDKIGIKGGHNIENAAAAILSAFFAGGTAEGIRSALYNFKGLLHRQEYVDTIKGVRFFDDSKGTNVDAVTRALEAFNQPVILIMGGRDKKSDYNQLKNHIKKHVKKLVVIGEAKHKIVSAIGKIKPFILASVMSQAVSYAYNAANSGDIVLLSPGCSSFDMYSSYAQRGDDFQSEVKKLKQAV